MNLRGQNMIKEITKRKNIYLTKIKDYLQHFLVKSFFVKYKILLLILVSKNLLNEENCEIELLTIMSTTCLELVMKGRCPQVIAGCSSGELF